MSRIIVLKMPARIVAKILTAKKKSVGHLDCPACPDLQSKIERLSLSLLGADGTGLNTGVIRTILTKLDQLEAAKATTASWISILKPVAISVIVTAITTFLIVRFG